MLILPAEDVRRALPRAQTIAAMKSAYAALSAGKAEVPLRSRLPIPPHEAVSLFMPVFLQDESGEALAVKIVSLFPNNHNRNLPLIHAAVVVLESDTGRPMALLEGSTLTAVRTIQTAWIYDSQAGRVATFIHEMAGQGPIPADLRAAHTPQQAVAEADIICSATTSLTPVFADSHLKPGVHINGVGSYTPEMQEIPPETVQRAQLVVDSRSAALSEAGDLIQPIRQGLMSEAHIHAELGEIVLGLRSGRGSETQVTFFKSVGVAVQDAAAARLALSTAQELGLGQIVEW